MAGRMPRSWVLREVVHGSATFARVVALRQAVLRTPLGLQYSAADLAAEHDQFHLALFEHETPVASGILQWQHDAQAKMRQMAVDQAYRGRGLGAQLVKALEAEAARRGIRRIVLHARASALGFYERLGYTCVGDAFEEVGLPHRRMEKVLPDGEMTGLTLPRGGDDATHW